MRFPQPSLQARFFRAVFLTFLVAFVFLSPFRALASTGQLVSSPSGLMFGTVALGSSEVQLIVLTNTGTGNVTISNASVTSSDFTLSGLELPEVLASGQSVDVEVQFKPTATGWVGANIEFTGGTSGPALLRMNVGGNGGTSAPLTATPAIVPFGPVAVGSTQTINVVLTNPSWTKTLTAFDMEGTGFKVNSPALPLTIPRGQSATLSISFSPQAAGTVGGAVYLAGGGISIPLSGTGWVSGQLTVSPNAVNFGSVDIGNAASETSTLSATGGSVIVSSASSSNSQFTLSGVTFPLTINQGQSVSVSVIFTPTKTGSSSASLTFSSSASGSASASLAGTGITTQYSVNLSWNASTSTVSGYNVYRGISPGSYSKINTALDPNTAFTDSTVVSGTTYYYATTAVTSAGSESSYSSPVEVAIP